MIEYLFIFIFGALFGSFLNVIILRIPKDESIIFPASHCFTCNAQLKPWHNIPLFSWIFLRGKCAFCKTKISTQYPLVELISAVLFTTITYKIGVSISSFLIAFTFLILLALSIIDIRYKMVPDSLNLLALSLAIVSTYSLHMITLNFYNALLFAGGFTLLRFALSYILTALAHKNAKKHQTSWIKNYDTYPFIEALGEADIIIVATMAAILGVKLTLFAIFLSAILALPVMLAFIKRSAEEQKIPFIPFLTLATLITYLFSSEISQYLRSLYA